MGKRAGHRHPSPNESAAPGISRRQFLAGAAAVAAAGLTGGAGWYALKSGRPSRHLPLFLTPERFECLQAACDRVLPPDGAPGAASMGAAVYIDRLLAEDSYTGDFLKWRAIFAKGLEGIDSLAQGRHGRCFARLVANDQDAILADCRDPAFLATLIKATLDGVLYDPFYGGNRDAAGWRLVGFSPTASWSAKGLGPAGATQPA